VERSLPAEDRALVAALGLGNFLHVASVVERSRAAGRLILRPEVVGTVERYVAARGGCALRAPFFHAEKPSPVAGTHHAGSFVSAPENGARPVLYFGLTEAFARGAMQADLSGAHALLGRLFAYPACCADAYDATATARQLDHLPTTIADVGPYPAALNPVVPYVYGLPHLLFHFPCSPRCAPSQALLARRARRLAAWDDRLARWPRLGRGIAVYSPTAGIALVGESERVDETTYRVASVVTAAGSAIRAGTLLRIAGPHAFDVDGEPHGGRDAFVAHFG
jgi:hypothetical protein